jgi:hypothetical protein
MLLGNNICTKQERETRGWGKLHSDELHYYILLIRCQSTETKED